MCTKKSIGEGVLCAVYIWIWTIIAWKIMILLDDRPKGNLGIQDGFFSYMLLLLYIELSSMDEK